MCVMLCGQLVLNEIIMRLPNVTLPIRYLNKLVFLSGKYCDFIYSDFDL